MKQRAIHFSTMLAASLKTNGKIEDRNPDKSYTNVTRFDINGVKNFCKQNKNYEPLKMAINSSLGDFIALRK